MSSNERIDFGFVEAIPDAIDAGVVYISPAYATSVHRCPCGCGTEVVLPLSPSDWSVTFDGETISFFPSVWNRRMACGAHYWIKRNCIQWVGTETDAAQRSSWPRRAWRRLLKFVLRDG